MPCGDFIVSPNSSNDDIVFQPKPSMTGQLTQEEQDFIFNVESTLNVVRFLYKAKPTNDFANYFDQLLKSAQLGLVGPVCQLTISKRAVDQIRSEITDRESSRIKNTYLKALGAKALRFGAPVLLLAWIFNLCSGTKLYNFMDVNAMVSLFFIWPGCMAGVWLSFSITRPTLGFDDLMIIEKDGLEPAMRLLFTGLLSMVFALLFMKGAMSISLGKLSSGHLKGDEISSFIIGCILGLNEKLIGSSLTTKTAALFKS